MGSPAAVLVREATDLVGLIGEVTQVRRAGGAASVMAMCPFHPNSDTAAMSVDGERGLYHCFGCGASGDALTFVQQTHGVGFRESLDLLARRAGVDLGPSTARPSRAQRLDAVRWQTAVFCHQLLVSDDSGAAARAYLRRTHRYGSDDVRAFHIGWAPTDPTVIPKHLGSLGVSEGDMVAAGVARRGPSRPFAQHFGRVLYPVVTGPERVSGFAAEDRDGGIEHPRRGGRSLFGFGQARSPIAREATAVVVSGYPTVVAYHRVGLANTVAPCGPHPTADQVATLSRWCDRAVVLTPNDAATRHLLDSDPGGHDLDLYVAEAPAGEGADITREAVVAAAQSALPLPEARLVSTLAGYRGAGSFDARRRKLTAAHQVISAEPDLATRMELAAAAAALTGLPVERVLGADSLLDPADHHPQAPALALSL